MTERIQKRYPFVLSPAGTLDFIEAGQSIARFGDGEFKLASGSPKNVSQINSPELQHELVKILSFRQKGLLIGIPDMNPKLPKAHIWTRYKREYAEYLDPMGVYANAFITRPDSDHTINNSDYYDRVEKLWRGEQVTLIGNGTRSLTANFLIDTGAKEVAFVPCPYTNAYAEIDRIEDDAKNMGFKRIIICAGAAGTCLAARLSLRNFHALDLGHIGMFWRGYAKKSN